MLADAPDVDGYTRTNRPLPEERSKGDVADAQSAGLPVSRMGLEQEFFLVDREGAPSDLADLFLRRVPGSGASRRTRPALFQSRVREGSGRDSHTAKPSSCGPDRALPEQPRVGAAGRLGARPRLVSVGDVPPPDKPRAPRRPRLQGQGQHHRAREVLARGQVRRGAPAPGVARSAPSGPT